MAKIIFDPELAQQLRTGTEKVGKLVSPNFGPLGRNTIRDQKYDLPLVANSGRKVLKELALPGDGENVSAVLLREAALNISDHYGDGALTTAVLAQALIIAGQKLIAAGYNPMQLRKGIHALLPQVGPLLEEMSVPLDDELMEKFAQVTAKNEEVGVNVVKACRQVGTDGIITVLDSQARETVLNLWDGVRYDYGLYNMIFATDGERKRAVLEKPYVLLCNVKIQNIRQIQKILEDVVRQRASLLIIAQDVSDEVMRILAANAARGVLKVCIGKGPGFGDTRRRNMTALAAKTGSMLYEDGMGRTLEECGLEICAQVNYAELDKDQTVLQGFTKENPELVEILRKQTLEKRSTVTDEDEVEKLELTLSILNGKTAEIQVGAVIEYEMFEKKYLYENTIRAVQNAAKSGLVPGAGSAFLWMGEKLRPEAEKLTGAEREGAVCLCEALAIPAKLLADNAGEDGNFIVKQLLELGDPRKGYDVLDREITDLQEKGIMTPCNAARSMVEIAVETAASIWTTGAAVVSKKKPE